MTRRRRLVVATATAVVAMSLVLVGTLQSAVPFIGPADLTPDREGQRVQVEGVVTSIEVATDHLLLELSDGAGGTALVRYASTYQRPITLEEGRLVVAKGVYLDGVLDAHQVSVRAHVDTDAP